MAKNLIDESKVYIKYYYNGTEWEKDVDYKFNGHKLDKEVIDFVGEFFHFLIDSTFLSDVTKMWLNSNLSSVRQMVEAHNSQVVEIDKLNINTVQSSITYDKNKLKKYFDDNMLLNVMSYPEKYLEELSLKLDSLQRIYMKDGEYNHSMVIKIPSNVITKQVDDNVWFKLKDLLKTYSKREIKKIEEGNNSEITDDVFGYYNYLISSKKLNDEEKKRLSEIRQILGI